MIDVKEKMTALRKGLEAVLAKGNLSGADGSHWNGLCGAVSHNVAAQTGVYRMMSNFMHGSADSYIDSYEKKGVLTPTRMNVVLLLLELDDEDLAMFYEEAPTV